MSEAIIMNGLEEIEGEDDLLRERTLIKASLEETIAIRKAERKEEAEMRRRSDLELIKRRNWEPEGAQNPLKLFPKEIWTMILGYLSAAEDVKNARDVCSLFKEILERKHFGLVLVPEVLSVLTFRSRWRRGNGRPATNCDFFTAAPKLVMLRELSRQWRQGVDSYFEEGIRGLGWSSTSKDFGGLAVHLCPLPELLEDVHQLSERFSSNQEEYDQGGSGTSPLKFFQRYISLALDRSTHPEALRSLVLTEAPRLVDTVGSQILRLDVELHTKSIHEAGLTLAQTYLQLRSMVERMTRLVWLEVKFDPMEGRYDSFTQEEVAELRDTIQAHPFPMLPNLRTLILSANIPEVAPETLITSAISEQNLHARDLGIHARDDSCLWTEESPILPTISRMENVDSLTLHSPCLYPNMLQTSWPLKKLRIELINPVNVHNLFRMIENFPTLQRVELKLGDAICQYPGFLRLPQVTYFSYSFNDISTGNGNGDLIGMLSIDFIYPMKQLEFFSWTFAGSLYYMDYQLQMSNQNWGDENPDEIIQFNGGKVSLKDSNMWDLLPSLKTVELKTPYKRRTEVFHRKSDGFVFEPKEDLNFSDDEEEEEESTESDGSETLGSSSESEDEA